jgi:hypothetical protein
MNPGLILTMFGMAVVSAVLGFFGGQVATSAQFAAVQERLDAQRDFEQLLSQRINAVISLQQGRFETGYLFGYLRVPPPGTMPDEGEAGREAGERAAPAQAQPAPGAPR